MMHFALPIAPLFLLPFIVVCFISVFPLWVVAIAVLGLLMVLSRALEWVVRLATTLDKPVSGPVSNAFHWTLSWGGLAERRDRPRANTP